MKLRPTKLRINNCTQPDMSKDMVVFNVKRAKSLDLAKRRKDQMARPELKMTSYPTHHLATSTHNLIILVVLLLQVGIVFTLSVFFELLLSF